jgi:hypothetical protein
MRRISKRIEALERAADKEVFADAFPFAIAYYLGGARDLSEAAHGYARALGYKDLRELVKASAYLFCQRLERKGERAAHEARIQGARCKLLAEFGYSLRRRSPAALADARYRIARTLPEKWRAMIKSAHRKDCELEAKSNQLLEEFMEVAEQFGMFAGPNGAKATEDGKKGYPAQGKRLRQRT